MSIFEYNRPFELESGASLSKLTLAYTTFGKLSANKNNVVWVLHALTANANPMEWWPGLVGSGCLLSPEKYYIVCANMLGSCYGTTGPESINPETGTQYGMDFPQITIRDMVKAYELLREYLSLEKIFLGIGGSMGGQQLLEWNIMNPGLFENNCLIATNMRHSAWGIAFNAAQRMAMEADPTLYQKTAGAGLLGLKAARAIAMLSYRNAAIFRKKQTDTVAKMDGFKAESYLRYQGEKLGKRFSPQAYWFLTKAMDSHHIGRGRKAVRKELKKVKANTLVISIKNDLLFSFKEQRFMASGFKNGRFELIESYYGHDGFLIETAKLSTLIEGFIYGPER